MDMEPLEDSLWDDEEHRMSSAASAASTPEHVALMCQERHGLRGRAKRGSADAKASSSSPKGLPGARRGRRASAPTHARARRSSASARAPEAGTPPPPTPADDLRAAILTPDQEDVTERGAQLLDELVESMMEEVVDEVVEGFCAELENCPICYEDVRPANMEVTPCNHRFCKTCSAKIKETRPFCPMCRARIAEDPPLAASPMEDSVLHLLVGLLSMSHSVGANTSVGREARRVLHDIVLAMHSPGYATIHVGFESPSRDREGDGDAEEDAETPATPSSPDEPVPPLTPPDFRHLLMGRSFMMSFSPAPRPASDDGGAASDAGSTESTLFL